jgi:type II secretory pathway component GspD/PulD (secretin)
MAWADYPIEIIPLKHQTVEQMLPMLRPFVAAGGTVTGMNGQLIVKTTPENLAQLRQVIDKFDRAPRQLRIEIQQSDMVNIKRRGVGVNGTVPIGDHGSVTVGRPSDHGVDVHIQDRSKIWSTDANRYVRATEGMPAFIQTGYSVPVASGYTDAWGRYRWERSYHDVTSGFYVTPWINGDRVTLEISPFRGQLTNRRNTFRVQQITTRVTGKLGEWISLGGADMLGQGGSQGLSGYSSGSSVNQTPVSVKVELLP